MSSKEEFLEIAVVRCPSCQQHQSTEGIC